MAWGNGGIFVPPMIGSMTGVALEQMKLASDSFKLALFGNTPTPNYSDTLANCVYGAGQWVTGNEIIGTGWAAGGVVLGTPALTESPAGTLKWTAVAVSVATTTLVGVYGGLIYDATLATKYALCAVPFPGGPYSTSAGILSVAWNAGGIFTLDITP
jgi:hypothetical protein